jgi:hypothetical protein
MDAAVVSATNRSDVRDPDDFYETPAWCVHRLIEAIDLPRHGSWLEPSAGANAIVSALVAKSDLDTDRRIFMSLDINPRCPLVNKGDFLSYRFDRGFDVIIGNPPYRLAEDFARRAVGLAPTVAFLLRLNWLASAKRAEWMREHTPSIYVLPNRPSFTGGGTDATDYAWFVWRKGVAPEVKILATTPASERRPA